MWLFILDLVCSFDLKEDKHSFYRGKNCIKKFCSEPKELGTKVVNYEQIEITPMKFFFMKVKKYVIYAKERFVMIKNKKRDLSYTKKLEIIVILQKNLEELLIAFVI